MSMHTERTRAWGGVCGALLSAALLAGCRCSASASLETDSEVSDPSDAPVEPGPAPDVIPAEASPIPANIPTFLVDACLARFTRETELVDFTGKHSETVAPGDVRVLSEWIGEPHVLDITEEGVKEYRISSEVEQLPFESNCEKGKTVVHSAVFVESSVFKSDDFVEELCRLEKGTVAKDDTAHKHNIGGGTFRFSLGGLSALCKGAEEGVIRLDEKTARDPRKLRPVHPVLFPNP